MMSHGMGHGAAYMYGYKAQTGIHCVVPHALTQGHQDTWPYISRAVCSQQIGLGEGSMLWLTANVPCSCFM